MTTKITEQNISNIANAGVQWQSVVTADGSTGLTVVAGRGYFIDTTSATQTVTLPASPNIGDTISIRDYAGTFGTNKVSISRNGQNLGGNALDGELTTNNTQVTFVYVDSTQGWLSIENEAKTTPLVAQFTTATGGTVTTSGDYKIHTFTGDGCFAVSAVGNSPLNPSGGPAVVDYLVVAGGGGGGELGGGGGAGGYRESKDSGVNSPHCGSPKITTTGLTITSTTYPVTVGAGGVGNTGGNPANPVQQDATNGSNSVFSTITSAGGGFGGSHSTPRLANTGGSGGGSASTGTGCRSGAAGNTPPVSPPQGNAGGDGNACNSQPSGGGGGAAGVGGTGNTTTSGGGGDGAGTGINPSPCVGTPGPSGPLRYFAGGGGGGARQDLGPHSAGNGINGGGNGGTQNGSGNATAGTANTGGGGGGGGYGSPTPGVLGEGRAGGKGIVIIRYKYQ